MSKFEMGEKLRRFVKGEIGFHPTSITAWHELMDWMDVAGLRWNGTDERVSSSGYHKKWIYCANQPLTHHGTVVYEEVGERSVVSEVVEFNVGDSGNIMFIEWDGVKTVARMHGDKATTTCSPYDRFNIETGAITAVTRLVTKPRPKKLVFRLEGVSLSCECGTKLKMTDKNGHELYTGDLVLLNKTGMIRPMWKHKYEGTELPIGNIGRKDFTFFKSYKEMSPCIIDGVVYEYED